MVKEEFIEAVRTGREIEFTCDRISYFESRITDDRWYIYTRKVINLSNISNQPMTSLIMP